MPHWLRWLVARGCMIVIVWTLTDSASEPIRLLQFAPAFAAHPASGAELRSRHLAAALARHMAVTHVGFTPAGVSAAPETDGIRFLPVPRPRAYRLWDLLRGALGPVPFPMLNYTRDNMRAALAEILSAARFDIVQLESIHLAGYLPFLRSTGNQPLVVCDWHNIESALLFQRSRMEKGLAGRLYIRRQAKLLEKYERWFVNRCDAHIVCSDADRETLLRYGAHAPVFVIGNGVDMQQFPHPAPQAGADPVSARKRVLFVGSMDYHPNIDAVKYFAAEVWPQVHRQFPSLVFTIAGRNPSADVSALAGQAGIEITGTVPDVRPYYRQAFAAVVPLRMGGGTRLKILEAMAAGLPVISTTLGAEGLDAVPGVHYFQANTAAAMLSLLLEAARGSPEITRVARAGRELVEAQYDWQALGNALSSHLLALLDARRE
jgi:polysaccharide biosynthesis protein PslH